MVKRGCPASSSSPTQDKGKGFAFSEKGSSRKGIRIWLEQTKKQYADMSGVLQENVEKSLEWQGKVRQILRKRPSSTASKTFPADPKQTRGRRNLYKETSMFLIMSRNFSWSREPLALEIRRSITVSSNMDYQSG